MVQKFIYQSWSFFSIEAGVRERKSEKTLKEINGQQSIASLVTNESEQVIFYPSNNSERNSQ